VHCGHHGRHVAGVRSINEALHNSRSKRVSITPLSPELLSTDE
jgi:hypothetical protein